MDNEEIRTILERKVKAVTLRPSVGQNTARTTVRLKPGLECEVTEGPWSLTVAHRSWLPPIHDFLYIFYAINREYTAL